MNLRKKTMVGDDLNDNVEITEMDSRSPVADGDKLSDNDLLEAVNDDSTKSFRLTRRDFVKYSAGAIASIYIGWSAPFGSGMLSSAHSPILLSTTHVVDAAVQTINALHKNSPFDFGISLC